VFTQASQLAEHPVEVRQFRQPARERPDVFVAEISGPCPGK
jgi:hypothetical protein